MAYNSMSLMQTKLVQVSEIHELSEVGSYVRHLTVTDARGEQFDIAIHADNRESLEVQE